jgi:uncharacterized integral membrane protein
MRARTVVLAVILVGVGIFAALNWSVFTTPTPLHLVVTRTEAPLGVILLAVIAGITLLYVLFVTWLETAALLESRRSARELQAQRQLAENAEASRYADLKGTLERELGEARRATEAVSQTVLARLDQLGAELRGELERAGNTLAAYIGELEDRLSRPGPGPS